VNPRELPAVARFATGLWSFLREPPLTLEQARQTVARRLRAGERERAFLAGLRAHLDANPKSPYRRLLALAGCELADVERSVRSDGLEPALAELRRAGVYVTFEEFKGREPIVRHGREIAAGPGAFDNPLLRRSLAARTGGSTGTGTRVALDLDAIREAAPLPLVARHVHGLHGLPTAAWRTGLPSFVGIHGLLSAALLGDPPERWFVPVSDAELQPTSLERLATSYLLAAARWAGRPLPRPEPVPLDDPAPIVRWARETLERRGACVVRATVSGALRIALRAREMGADLTGAVLAGGSEPPTPAKVAGVRSSGARFHGGYASVECGIIGVACARPQDESDVHFTADGLALIQHPREVADTGVRVDAFNFTTLRATAPKMLLNVESDDFGVIEERRCGCPFDELGLHRHIRQVRSFRKLTGEGMTLVGSDAVRILEVVLPARFGGTPFDYQLVEAEDAIGLTRLCLRVHPRLAIADPGAIEATFLAELRSAGGGAKLSQAIWGRAATVQVRREVPTWTAAGKFLPLQALGLEAARRDETSKAVAV
jgi:hypothetical protein